MVFTSARVPAQTQLPCYLTHTCAALAFKKMSDSNVYHLLPGGWLRSGGGGASDSHFRKKGCHTLGLVFFEATLYCTIQYTIDKILSL